MARAWVLLYAHFWLESCCYTCVLCSAEGSRSPNPKGHVRLITEEGACGADPPHENPWMSVASRPCFSTNADFITSFPQLPSQSDVGCYTAGFVPMMRLQGCALSPAGSWPRLRAMRLDWERRGWPRQATDAPARLRPNSVETIVLSIFGVRQGLCSYAAIGRWPARIVSQVSQSPWLASLQPTPATGEARIMIRSVDGAPKRNEGGGKEGLHKRLTCL